MTTMQAIQSEMMSRRQELIDLQSKIGGCAAIRLKADNIDFCYNPKLKTTSLNPLGEKFYITGVMRGMPISINESDVYDS